MSKMVSHSLPLFTLTVLMMVSAATGCTLSVDIAARVKQGLLLRVRQDFPRLLDILELVLAGRLLLVGGTCLLVRVILDSQFSILKGC